MIEPRTAGKFGVITLNVVFTSAGSCISPHPYECSIADGHDVVGVDCSADRGAGTAMRHTPDAERKSLSCNFNEVNVVTDPLDKVRNGANSLFHQVRESWLRLSRGSGFHLYLGEADKLERLGPAYVGSGLYARQVATGRELIIENEAAVMVS